MRNRIKRRLTGVPATCALACLLAAGVASAAASDKVFSGLTSQHHSVGLTETSSNNVGFNIAFGERCYTPSHKRSGSSSGHYGFNTAAGVHADSNGRFSHHFHTTHQLTSSGNELYNGDYSLSGRIQGRTAKGKFSVTVRFYTLHGTYLGPCQTGTLSWSASQK